MKRLLLSLVFLLCVDPISAQDKIFVGETSLITTFSFGYGYGECKPMVQGPMYPFTRFNWDAQTGKVTGYFTKPGTYHDTAKFQVWFPSGRCGQSGVYTLTATAVVHSDSVIRMLPRALNVELTADTIKGGWVGSVEQKINHKIATNSIFRDWRITVDSTLAATVTVLKDGATIGRLDLAPLQSDVKITYQIRAANGPIYSGAHYQATLSVRVTNSDGDSIYVTPIAIKLLSPEWRPWFGFSADTLRIAGAAGASLVEEVGLKLDPRTTAYTLRQLDGMISSEAAPLQGGDSSSVKIKAHGWSAGKYLERLKVWSEIPDHNGKPRRDSDEVVIELVLTSGQQNPYWEPTDGAFTNTNHMSLHESGEVYVASDKLYRTTDEGRHWSLVPIQDTSLSGLFVSQSGYIYITGNDQRVRVSKDEGITWSTAPLGTSYYYYQQNFVPFQISRLGGAGNLAFARGSTRYYHPYYREDVFASGTSWTDNGDGWSIAETRVGNTLIQDVEVAALDSSYHYLHAAAGFLEHRGTGRGYRFTHQVQGLAVDGYGNFYALTGDGLYASTDIGYSWQRRSLIFDSVKGFAVAADGELFVASANSVYHSMDGGGSWEAINGGLGSTKLTSLALKAGGRVFLGTLGGGVYRSKSDTKLANTLRVSSLEPAPLLGEIIHLDRRRYLRVFDQTTIVTVADLLGRKFSAPLIDGAMELPQGPLLIRLTDRGQSQTFKTM